MSDSTPPGEPGGVGSPAVRLILPWSAVALALAGLIVFAQASRGSLDDPQPGRQRPGILLPIDGAARAPVVGDDEPARGRPAVVFFVRDAEYGALTEVLTSGGEARRFRSLRPAPDLIIVLPHRPDTPVVATTIGYDTDGRFARAFGMPTPKDGGPPVGYALVDAAGRVRYHTLDPAVVSRLREVRTMMAAMS